MKSLIKNYLEENGYFRYGQFKSYLPQLEGQMAAYLGPENVNRVTFPQLWKNKISLQLSQSFLVADLGGMYLRLYWCEVSAKGKLNITHQYKKPFYESKTYTPEIFFNDLKDHFDQFLASGSNPPQTLVFSFGNALRPHFRTDHLLDGEILYWGKNHQQRGMLGIALGQQLQNFLNQNGYPKLQIHVVNDSFLALLSSKTNSTKIPPIINLVVGSGTNLSVGFNTTKGFQMINLEFGDFDFFPYDFFDDRLNYKSLIPNKFRTEKLFAGAWQHYLFRIIVKRACLDGILIKHPEFSRFKTMSAGDLEDFFAKSQTFPHFRELKYIWTAITERGAFVCALGVYCLIKQLKKQKLINQEIYLSEIGAQLEHSKEFRKQFHKRLNLLLKNDKNTAKIKLQNFLVNDRLCHGALRLLDLCRP